MKQAKSSHAIRLIVVTALVSMVGLAGIAHVFAGGTPAAPSDLTSQLITQQGVGAGTFYGDYISGPAPGLNTYYSYFIEVPSGLTSLVVDIFDADVGFGASDQVQERDKIRTSWDTSTTYTLYDPSGTPQATQTCNNTATAFCADNAWTNLHTAATPANGHWELRVDMGSGNDVNAFGLRANDGVGSVELNVYADSFWAGGVNENLGARDYTLYPYVTSGCNANINDFDWDADQSIAGSPNTTPYGSLSLISRLTTFTHNNATMSNNDAWLSSAVGPGWTTDVLADDYGLWEAAIRIEDFGAVGNGQGNYGVVYMGNYAHAGGAPSAQPETNTFRMYFLTDAAGAPTKPYVSQSLSHVSGPNPPQSGQTSVYQVTVNVVNPAGSLGSITFSAPTNLVTAYVPGSGVTYQGNDTVTHGSVTGEPAIGGTGDVTWNPGTLASGTTAQLTYQVNVTPSAPSQRLVVTGTPSANGTTAQYVDGTGNATQTRATYTFGPLCELAATSVPTAVELMSFTAEPAGNAIELRWETATEFDNLGFNLYRTEILGGPRIKLNATLIPAQTPGSVVGATYQFADESVSAGVTYYYWLEDVDLYGVATLHGPASAQVTPLRRLLPARPRLAPVAPSLRAR